VQIAKLPLKQVRTLRQAVERSKIGGGLLPCSKGKGNTATGRCRSVKRAGANREMRGLILLAALVCVAAYSPSKAIEPECVEPRSTCATQQTAANKHFQEMAIAAANHMGLCTATEADTRNNDGYLLGMLKARLNH